MFQIVCTLTLYVPAVARGITDLHGVSPDVLLSSVPWGHANHTGVACGCRASDRTGAYVHAVMAAHGGPADPGCSLPCAHIKHAAECPPALLQDTADCSPAAVAPVKCPDLASPADFASEFGRPFSGEWVQRAVSHGICPSPA